MRALVFHGPSRTSWDVVPDPSIIDSTDAVVRVDTTTLCGTDLHILKGDVPTVTPGRVLGHEAVGTVTEVGDAVTSVHVGDRVLVSCVSACGRCRFCRDRMYGQCLGGGGWILGHTIDGTQAELVRVPFADTSTYPLPAGLDDESALMLSDILPTAYEVGVVNGGIRPGDTVAVVGAGPIGLAAVQAARLFSPAHVVAIDLVDSRLEAAKQFGADVTVNPSPRRRRRAAGPAHRRARGRRRHRGRRAAAAPSRPAHGSSAPADASPTSVSTAARPRCTWRTCGPATSPSPQDWWTPGPRRPCSSC